MTTLDTRGRARRRALRAAQVVTLGLAMAGCGTSHTPRPGDAGPRVADAATSPDGGPTTRVSDSGAPRDSGLSGGPTDAATADAGIPCADAGPDEWAQCCEDHGWPCDWATGVGCCAWGPYVPPGEALPVSRSATQLVRAVRLEDTDALALA